MSAEGFNALLSEFGRKIGLPKLRADESGYCALSFDDVDAHLQYEGEQDEVVVFTRLGTVDLDDPTETYARLLGGNLFWEGTGGATLAVEPETGMVFLQAKAAVRSLDGAGFGSLLERFIVAAERWRKEIVPDAGAVGEAVPLPGTDSFVRG
jgi:Tir chaperone protein (CesT) family